MSMTDPIADFLTRIRNAMRVSHAQVKVPGSNMAVSVLNVLKTEGYIRDFAVNDTPQNQKEITIDLKYNSGRPAITQLDRISKPGRRVYSSIEDMPKVNNGLGIYIMSTSCGVMTDHQARQQNVGGEILCLVF